MKNILKWEHKRKLAMVLVWSLLFGLFSNTSFSMVYAEETVEQDVEQSDNGDSVMQCGSEDGEDDVSADAIIEIPSDVSDGDEEKTIFEFDADSILASCASAGNKLNLHISGNIISEKKVKDILYQIEATGTEGQIEYSYSSNFVYSFSFYITLDKKQTVKLYATSEDDSKIDYTVEIDKIVDADKIDDTKYVNIKGIDIEGIKKSKYGNCSNDEIRIQVTKPQNTKIANIYKGNKDTPLDKLEIVCNEDGSAVITELPELTTLWIQTEDNNGISSKPVKITKSLARSTSDLFLIEKNAPIISCKLMEGRGENLETGNNNFVIWKDTKINIQIDEMPEDEIYENNNSVSDKCSGIKYYHIEGIDLKTTIEKDNLSKSASVSKDLKLKLNNKLYQNGYTISLKVIAEDYAGNENVQIFEFYVDKDAPTVVKFVYKEGENETQDVFPIKKDENAKDFYKHFFQKDIGVRLYFTDGVAGKSSEISSIICRTEDVKENNVEREIKDVKKSTETGENKEILYYGETTIEAGFKGYIFACASDARGNQMSNYVQSSGVVVEPESVHKKEKHIKLDLPASSVKDSKGNYMYAKNVTIPVTVIDTMSGIKSVEWKVDAPFDKSKNYDGSINITYDKNDEPYIKGDSSIEWTVPVEKGRDQNLVTMLQGKVPVTNNSNDIKVWVKMTDNAGNTDESIVTIHIDKTKPTIEISFDNNDPDDVYQNIYSQDRTATITVKERNFSENKIAVEITNAIGEAPKISSWHSHKNEKNPDESTHTATVVFSQDGEYTMKISGEDKLGNNAEQRSVDLFIIDKTIPTVEVSYSNNNAKNGNYYADNRLVNVTITERNFAPERVHLSGTVVENGQTKNLPSLGNFVQHGNNYTATIMCQEEGYYSFDIEYSDKAGNKGQTYVANPYYIDKTIPEIHILDVEPNSANNGDVAPRIEMTDSNFDANAYSIQLIGENQGIIDIKGVKDKISKGESFAFENFPKELRYDDLYTLQVAMEDLAGNKANEEIQFSVNRFGSVYIFDEKLKALEGTYTNNSIEVSLTEVNIDPLQEDSIKVSIDYNGNFKDLVRDEDYTIQQIDGPGSWYRYNYSLNNSLFEDDGRYRVVLYSVDKAGNVNQNIDENKKAEISFGVDKTAPVVVPINVENNKQYAVDVKNAMIAVNDNLVLSDVAIYIDGQICEYTNDGDNYKFDIPSSAKKQTITVVAKDVAGNTTEYMVKSILVNTNFFIRWYNNRPLFVGSIIVLIGMCGAAVIGIPKFRRKKHRE